MSLPNRSIDRVYLIREAALILGLSFLILLSGSTNGLTNPDVQIGLAALVSAAALAWIFTGQRAPTPGGRALLAWVGIYLITVIFSLDPRRSLTQMELMSISIFLFALGADLAARGWGAELIVKALLIVGGMATLTGWAQALIWYAQAIQAAAGQGLPDVLYRPASANVVAMFMNLMLLLSLARMTATPSKAGKVILALLALASAGLLFLTSSRGGWLGAAAGLLALGLLFLNKRRREALKVWEWLRARKALRSAIGLALLAGGYLLYRQTIHPSHGPIADARSEYWPPAWQAFLSRPLTGSGPLSYAEAFMSANSVPPAFLYVHAHGTPFNLLAEMGLLGLAGMIVLVATLGMALWRRIKTAEGADWAVAAGAAGCLVAVAVHSLVDGFHTEPVGLWVFVIALGAALGYAPRSVLTGAKRARFSNLWALLLPVALWAEIWMAAPLNAGVRVANENRWQAAAEDFDQAVARDNASVIAWQQDGLSYAVLAQQGNPGALEKAVRAFEETVRREPGWALNHANLGALYLQQNRIADAQRELQESLKRAPGCSFCALNLGVAFEAGGDEAAAIRAYQTALRLGQTGPAFFWRSSRVRNQAWQQWLAENPQTTPSREALYAVLKSDLSSLPAYLPLIRLDLAENRLDEAQALLAQSAQAYSLLPADHLEHDWLSAELHALQGDAGGAIDRGQDTLARYLLQGPYGPGSFGMIYYAPLLFRKSAMAMELVPQLKLIVLPDEWSARAEQLAAWMDSAGQAQAAASVREQIAVLSK